MRRIVVNLMTILACVGTVFMVSSCRSKEQKKAPMAEIIEAQVSYENPVFANSHDGFLNIRELPSAKSAIVGRMYNGDYGAENMHTKSGNWLQVHRYGVIGWINTKYIQYSPSMPISISKSELCGVWSAESFPEEDYYTLRNQHLLFFEDGTYAKAERKDNNAQLLDAGTWELLNGTIILHQKYNMGLNTEWCAQKKVIVVREDSTKMLLHGNSEEEAVYKKKSILPYGSDDIQSNITSGLWSANAYNSVHTKVVELVK